MVRSLGLGAARLADIVSDRTGRRTWPLHDIWFILPQDQSRLMGWKLDWYSQLQPANLQIQTNQHRFGIIYITNFGRLIDCACGGAV